LEIIDENITLYENIPDYESHNYNYVIKSKPKNPFIDCRTYHRPVNENSKILLFLYQLYYLCIMYVQYSSVPTCGRFFVGSLKGYTIFD